MSAVRNEITTDTGSSVRIDSYPASEKIYIPGSRPDMQVPMRQINLSDTPAHFGAEKNPPIFVYDTSGPYTDPNVDRKSTRLNSSHLKLYQASRMPSSA